MVALVSCTTPGFLWPDNRYALKVCFNFELDTNQARNAYINEFIELVKLPSHPNIVRFLCEFVDEIHDNIRRHLPEFARESSIIKHRDGTVSDRKTQFFVVEFVEMSLTRLLAESFAPPPSIVPHRMVATIISQVGSPLRSSSVGSSRRQARQHLGRNSNQRDNEPDRYHSVCVDRLWNELSIERRHEGCCCCE